jgi:hypothetical protein
MKCVSEKRKAEGGGIRSRFDEGNNSARGGNEFEMEVEMACEFAHDISFLGAISGEISYVICICFRISNIIKITGKLMLIVKKIVLLKLFKRYTDK